MELKEYIEYLQDHNYMDIISEYNEKNELLFAIEKEIEDLENRIENAIRSDIEYDLRINLESKTEEKEEIERMLEIIKENIR